MNVIRGIQFRKCSDDLKLLERLCQVSFTFDSLCRIEASMAKCCVYYLSARCQRSRVVRQNMDHV